MVDVVEGGLGAVKGGAKGFFGGGILGGAAGLVLGAALTVGAVALLWNVGAVLGGIAWAASAAWGAVAGGASVAWGAYTGLGLFAKIAVPLGIIGGAVGAATLGFTGAAAGTVGGTLSGSAKGFFKKDAVSPELQAQLEHEREMNAQKMQLAQQLQLRAQRAGGFNNPDAKGGNVDRVMGGPEMAAPGMKRG
jgi:hypothetical protein